MSKCIFPHKSYLVLLLVVVGMLISVGTTYAGQATGDATTERLERVVDLDVDEWSFKWGDFDGPVHPSYDDSDWETVGTDHRWLPPNSKAWYRKWITIPEKIAGVDVRGSKVWLWMQFDDDGIVFVNGELVETSNQAEGRVAVLTESAEPGARILVTIQNINNAVSGSLESAELHSDRGEPVVLGIRRYLSALRQTSGLGFAGDNRLIRDRALTESVAMLDMAALDRGETDAFIASLDHAVERLAGPLDLIRSSTEPQLDEAARLLGELDELLATARERGIDISYPLVSRTVVNNFLTFARDDLGADESLTVLRGVAVADQLIAICRRASAETHRLLSDERFAANHRTPRYRTGTLEIRDGALYQGDRPVFLSGFGHFDQVRDDTPIFNDYGFNAIQIVIGPGGVVKRDSIDTTGIDNLVNDLDRAAEHNVAVDLLILDSFPGWPYDDEPGLRVEQTGSLCFNIEHPLARKVLRRYLEALIPPIAVHPALFSICLTNEPSYTDDGSISEREFHRWLMEKHGSIGALNTRYRTSYTGFDEAPLPTRAGIFDGDPPRPVWYDWCIYNQNRTYEHHRWLRDVIATMAPNLPVHVKIQGRVFDGEYPYSWGINPEDFTRLSTISGGDNHSYDQTALHREYAQGWRRQAMFYDFQRSVAPANPIFNSENHPIEDAVPIWVGSDHMRTMLWQGAIHGQGASTTWVWQRYLSQRGSFASNILTRPKCVDASGRTALDLMRLGDEIVTLQQARAEVAILFTPASIPQNEPYLDESKNAYEGLYFLDTPIRFVTDRIATRDISGYRVLVAPGNTYVADSTTGAITRFVQEGGTLLLVGDALTHDEYGRERSRGTTPILPQSAAQAPGTTWQVGAGRVVHVAASMEPKQYADKLDRLLDDVGVARKIRVVDHHQSRVWGVRTQTVERDGEYLIYLVNLLSRSQAVRLVADGPLGSVTDLLTSERSGPLLELKPLVPMVLSVQKL